jgi:hypothetical protein
VVPFAAAMETLFLMMVKVWAAAELAERLASPE